MGEGGVVGEGSGSMAGNGLALVSVLSDRSTLMDNLMKMRWSDSFVQEA
jgi:hypothetical protein